MREKSRRTCGTCTACCKTHPVVELNKSPRVWCPHCSIGIGCTIYDERPPGCKNFECQWLMGNDADDERPDRTKIVTDFVEIPPFGFTLMLHEATEGALGNSFTKRKTNFFLRRRIPVCHLPIRGKNTIHLPPNVVLSAGCVLPMINGKECDVVSGHPSR